MTGFRIKRVNLPAELELAVDFKNFVRYSREEEMDLIDLKVEGHVMEEGDLGQLTFENVFFDHCMFTADVPAIKDGIFFKQVCIGIQIFI